MTFAILLCTIMDNLPEMWSDPLSTAGGPDTSPAFSSIVALGICWESPLSTAGGPDTSPAFSSIVNLGVLSTSPFPAFSSDEAPGVCAPGLASGTGGGSPNKARTSRPVEKDRIVHIIDIQNKPYDRIFKICYNIFLVIYWKPDRPRIKNFQFNSCENDNVFKGNEFSSWFVSEIVNNFEIKEKAMNASFHNGKKWIQNVLKYFSGNTLLKYFIDSPWIKNFKIYLCENDNLFYNYLLKKLLVSKCTFIETSDFQVKKILLNSNTNQTCHRPGTFVKVKLWTIFPQPQRIVRFQSYVGQRQ